MGARMSRLRQIVLGLALAGLLAAPVQACRLALILAIDVSGSIDPGEYRLQMQGMADALEDSEIAHALVQSEAALMVVQWSGEGDQAIVVPWMRMLTPGHVARLAADLRSTRRRFYGGRTAIGTMMQRAIQTFDQVSDCRHRVIDISGDGAVNDGIAMPGPRIAARAAGVTVNGLAIDRIGRSITEFYRRHVITGTGSFVITARGYSDYPRAIRLKMLREVVVPGM